MNPRRPNTGVDDSLLHPDVILCCGEDANDLLRALSGVNSARVENYHDYRCFRFWKFPSFTLIWSGMGSGCLEPLLFEILSSDIVKRIVLVGTAGATSAEASLGSAYFIEQAFLGAAGIHLRDRAAISPTFDPTRIALSRLQSTSIVSTDYYYGFSQDQDPRAVALRQADPELSNSLATLWTRAVLVDMETAQFYQLCKLLGSPELRYGAIKGPANHVSEPAKATLAVMKEAVAGAFRMMELDKGSAIRGPQTEAAAELVNVPQLTTPSEASSAKLIEEIKLYWTIQVAVAGILGYLGSNLTFSRSGAEKNVYLCGVSFLLIAIGAVYNLIGNYYARMEGVKTDGGRYQENLFTPTLAVIYLIVSSILGGIFAYAIYTVLGIGDVTGAAIKGSALGFLLNWLTCRRIFRELYDNAPSSYREYSRHIRALYLYYDGRLKMHRSWPFITIDE